MRFTDNQSIKVSRGWHDARRRGNHLATIELDGRTWHIVQLKGDKQPILMMAGTIEATRPKRPRSHAPHSPLIEVSIPTSL